MSCAAGALDVVKKTIQWEGPQGLYKVSKKCCCEQQVWVPRALAQCPFVMSYNRGCFLLTGSHITAGRPDCLQISTVRCIWGCQEVALHQSRWQHARSNHPGLLQGTQPRHPYFQTSLLACKKSQAFQASQQACIFAGGCYHRLCFSVRRRAH
jgi:hypothetical protein